MKLYISSYDYKSFEQPVDVSPIETLAIGNREILKTKLTKPKAINVDNVGSINTDDLYLTPRYSLTFTGSLRNLPVDCYVMILKPGIEKPIHIDNFINVVWAKLYDNLPDAVAHI